MKALDITHEFLFCKDNKGNLKNIKSLYNSELNQLYGKELYIPAMLKNNREHLFQALGNLGAYGNNEFDSTIHYFL